MGSIGSVGFIGLHSQHLWRFLGGFEFCPDIETPPTPLKEYLVPPHDEARNCKTAKAYFGSPPKQLVMWSGAGEIKFVCVCVCVFLRQVQVKWPILCICSRCTTRGIMLRSCKTPLSAQSFQP